MDNPSEVLINVILLSITETGDLSTVKFILISLRKWILKVFT